MAMELLFVGTGAADWPPEFPETGTCPPGNYRGFASLLINTTVLVDCGTTVPEGLCRQGIDTANIVDVLITHSHGDHFSPDALGQLANTKRRHPLQVWGDPCLQNTLSGKDDLEYSPFIPFETTAIGGLQVTALPANHETGRPGEQALHFVFSDGNATVLYATDGAWFLKETWLYLRKIALDCIIWDATIGDTEGDMRIFEHNSIDMVRIMRDTFQKQGVLKPDAHIYLTHLARTLCSPHSVLTEQVAPENLIPAWDGMRVEIAP